VRFLRLLAAVAGWMPHHPIVVELQQRIARQQDDEEHYGRHALVTDCQVLRIPKQHVHGVDPTNTTRLFSGDVFVPAATR
jgi:hypothetical protein